MTHRFFIVYFLLVISGISALLYAQEDERCGDYSKIGGKVYKQQQALYEMQLQALLRKKRAVKQQHKNGIITIPVVVHILHDGEKVGSGKNLSDEQIKSQIEVLNEDFRRKNADTINTSSAFKSVAADVGIEFCLASVDPSCLPTTGITRHKVNSKSFALSDNRLIKSYGYWPADQYLNIWVCNISGYLGFASFPAGSGLSGLESESTDSLLDGVVVKYLYFGRINIASTKFNKGRTATHEIGHWLGLFHTWGDRECTDFSCPPCGTDYCNDTPEQDNSNSGCKSKTSTYCSATPITNMIENYLDYTDDGCMNMFTEDQKTRMLACLEVSPRRKSLLNSKGCLTNGNVSNFPFSDTFESNSIDANKWTYSSGWRLSPYGAYNSSDQSVALSVNAPILATEELSSIYIPMADNAESSNYITFDLAYLASLSNSNTDELRIYYSLYCDTTQYLLKNFTGNELITANRQEDNFVPTNSDWKNIRLYLDKKLNGTIIKLKFKFVSKNGNNIYFDNIHINNVSNSLFDVTINSLSESKQVSFEIDFVKNQKVKISIYDMMGKQISSDEYASFDGGQATVKTQLTYGLYIMKAELEGGSRIIKKFMVGY